jgi:C1A family cysteine protease
MIAQQESSSEEIEPNSSDKHKVKKIKNLNVNTDHSVVLLGWGHDDKTGPYWIVRNSFGKEWGQNGDF